MNNIVQYAQDVVGMSRRSHYLDAYRTVLGHCVAGVDSAADVPLRGLYGRVVMQPFRRTAGMLVRRIMNTYKIPKQFSRAHGTVNLKTSRS